MRSSVGGAHARGPLAMLVRMSMVVAAVVGLAACGDDGDDEAGPSFAADVEAALDAVDEELGGPQQYFEVTATSQLTNVFVAVDEATAAVPYVFVDGELAPPAPRQEGASGFTFGADVVQFDADAILSQVVEEVPGATIEALSVYGDDGGSVRYVVAVRSDAGGMLDVTVSPDGSVLAVDPV